MGDGVATVEQRCLIDLHLHLDGSISVPMARHLAELGGTPLNDVPDAELSRHLQVEPGCRDLNEYLARFTFPLSLLETPEQLTACTRMLLAELDERGLIYAELRFSPQSHGTRGLTQRGAVEAVLAGLTDSPIPAGIILCCMRGADNAAANEETVRLAAEYLGRGVVALDLAGAEALFPTAGYADLFALARELDVPLTIHAGEADGPKSVHDALAAGAQRIGHGVRAVEDPELLALLAERRIPLETCPTSEVQTCVFEGYEQFPLRQLLDACVVVTINSDNMAVSATDVRCELAAIAQTFSLTDADVRQLLLNAADAAFAPASLRAKLRAQIDEAFAA